VVDNIYQKIVDKVQSLSESDVAEDITQVAETFDALEAEGVEIPAMSAENFQIQANERRMQEQLQRYLKSRENHIPGKQFTHSDGIVYVVQDNPHTGMWVKNKKEEIINPNMNNNSVRRKLKKNPTKYNVINA